MSIVLDASVALAWILAEDPTDVATRAEQAMAAGPVHVPAIWALEVTNGLLIQARRNRIGTEDLALGLQHVARLDIRVDHADPALVCGPVATLAVQHRLTAYDAAYLELALRLASPLATLDSRLAVVAVAAGAQVL